MIYDTYWVERLSRRGVEEYGGHQRVKWVGVLTRRGGHGNPYGNLILYSPT